MQNDLITISIYAVVLFIGILITQNIMNKHYIQRLLYHHHKKRRMRLGGQTDIINMETGAKSTAAERKAAPERKVEQLPIESVPPKSKSVGWGLDIRKKR